MSDPKFYEYIEINDEPIPDGIVSGGIITWLYGLTFSMSAIVYYLDGERFEIPTTEFTLNNADPTDPRIDSIVVDNTGILVVLEGVPNVSPQKPSVDTGTQIELTYVLVQAAATEPDSVTDELIYDENVEWTGSAIGVVVDFANTDQHKIGSKCTEVGTIGNNDTITYTAAAPVNVVDYETLSFFLKLKAIASTKNAMYVKFMLGGLAVSNERPITWAITDITNWQGVTMLLADFTFTDDTFDAIQIRWTRVQPTTTTHVGFYLDYIKLQTGLPVPVYTDTIELIGDVFGRGILGVPFVTTLKTVNASVGTYGTAYKTPRFIVNAKGLIVGVTEVDIAAAEVFIYQAYGSDTVGTDFTLVNDSSLEYSALIVTDTEIPSPVVGDFAGLWYKRKGDQGPQGATSGQIYYLHHPAVSDPAGYEGLERIPADSVEEDESVAITSGSGKTLIDKYITLVNDPGENVIKAGIWLFDFFHYVSLAVGVTTFVYDVYKRAIGGTETLLFSVTSAEINDTSVAEFETAYVQVADIPLLTDDRIVVYVSAQTTSGASVTCHLVYEGTAHASHIHTPIGIHGTNGREIELSTDAGYIVWRYVGEAAWNNLILISDLEGPKGDPGDNAYVYIVYASDASGTDFTLTFDAALNYIAIKSSTVAIPSPVVGDFAGLWKNYKGAAGENATPAFVVSGITLSSGSWTGPSGGFYEYDLANANILSTSVVDGIPSKSSSAIVKAAEIESEGIVTAGHVKFYAKNAPTGDISLTIVITEATS